MVLEGVAGEEGAKGAALDGPFGLKTGVVVGGSVNDNWDFCCGQKWVSKTRFNQCNGVMVMAHYHKLTGGNER